MKHTSASESDPAADCASSSSALGAGAAAAAGSFELAAGAGWSPRPRPAPPSWPPLPRPRPLPLPLPRPLPLDSFLWAGCDAGVAAPAWSAMAGVVCWLLSRRCGILTWNVANGGSLSPPRGCRGKRRFRNSKARRRVWFRGARLEGDVEEAPGCRRKILNSDLAMEPVASERLSNVIALWAPRGRGRS